MSQGLRTHIDLRAGIDRIIDGERDSTDDKLQNAIRYLESRGKYVFQRPVQRRKVKPPILMQHMLNMQAQRNG